MRMDMSHMLYLTLQQKSMETTKRLKKASETGKMTGESFVSLANHLRTFGYVFNVVWYSLV